MNFRVIAKAIGLLGDAGFDIDDQMLTTGMAIFERVKTMSDISLDSVTTDQLQSLLQNDEIATSDLDLVASALRAFSDGSGLSLQQFFTQGQWAPFLAGSRPVRLGDSIRRCPNCKHLSLPSAALLQRK